MKRSLALIICIAVLSASLLCACSGKSSGGGDSDYSSACVKGYDSSFDKASRTAVSASAKSGTVEWSDKFLGENPPDVAEYAAGKKAVTCVIDFLTKNDRHIAEYFYFAYDGSVLEPVGIFIDYIEEDSHEPYYGPADEADYLIKTIYEGGLDW